MPELFFNPSARLQRFLGKELIADPNLAIIEFLKNSYDAGATEAHVHFTIDRLYKQSQIITISDNGTGMSLDEFSSNWMRPGYSYKSLDTASHNSERVPTGEKGLGRLSAERLGEVLEVYTRRSKSDKWLHVTFNWQDFSDMNEPLNKVPITYDFSAPKSSRFTTGTIIKISNLSIDWEMKVPGRKANGRTDIRLGRLRDDLSVLLRPLGGAHSGFKIFLGSDKSDFNTFHGEVKGEESVFLDYLYSFDVKFSEGVPHVLWQIKRSKSLAEQINTDIESSGTEVYDDKPLVADTKVSTLQDTKVKEKKSDLVGEFSGKFYYAPTSVSSKRMRELGIPSGVYLYRDNIRVEPYGDREDDWLGLRAWKASRQGYAPIQPNLLSGDVNITKSGNPKLIDMSNRQGLLENEEFETFIYIVRSQIRKFAGIVFEEYTTPNWMPATVRVEKSAQRAQSFASIVVRGLVHSIRQSSAGLGTELSNIKFIAKSKDIPDDTKSHLLDFVARSERHLKSIDATLLSFFENDSSAEKEEVSTFNIETILQEAIDNQSAMSNTFDVKVMINRMRGHSAIPVVTRAILLRQSVEILIQNAIQADRPSKSLKEVTINYQSSVTGHIIDVSDNGLGIEETIVSKLFERTVSTKGTTGGGLIICKESIAAIGGKVTLKETGPNGTIFRLWLPSVGSIRKESS